ncbi:MAG: sigma-70 family RNA polymerase sigma factor [bacterium]|nr:sigma-70 family RNA polymerase sigma factor [bacterium]
MPLETTSKGQEAAAGRRDGELRELFAELAPCRLEALDRIWELAADDLYGLALWRTGSAADAEDVVQEVFVRLARAAPKLAGVRKPFAYLLSMTHRAAIDTLRGSRRREKLVEAPQLAIVDPNVEQSADAAKASALLARLPPGQREVVYLRHFEDLTFREIGGVTGVGTFTAASRYRLAIRRLRKQMGVEP